MEREYWLTELGYFGKEEIEKIKAVVGDGITYKHYEAISSNYAGNYTLGIRTSYDDGNNSEEYNKNFFVSALISRLALEVQK